MIEICGWPGWEYLAGCSSSRVLIKSSGVNPGGKVPVLEVDQDVAESNAVCACATGSPLDEIVRKGARRMLAAALGRWRGGLYRRSRR
jgi:hypothetical protein